jgi:hypothetical protein
VFTVNNLKYNYISIGKVKMGHKPEFLFSNIKSVNQILFYLL